MNHAPIPDGATTRVLQRLRAGDETASEELLHIVYAELRRLAEIHMARQPAYHTWQPTALVHEAWLKLAGYESAHYENRKCFFAVASRIMRNLLVDHARARNVRHDGLGRTRVSLSEGLVERGAERELDLIALDEALVSLGKTDTELLQVVELHFFGGLTVIESAEVLGMPLRTFERALQVARLWLARHMSGGDAAHSAN